MAKIKIKGCGYCSKFKGCNIKKEFRGLASIYDNYTEIESTWYHSDLSYTHKRINEFELICPFGDRKYKDGDKIIFTLGIQRYKKTTKWECDNDCDGCCREDCEDGFITFENVRYKEKISVEGRIVNLYRNDKWVVSIEEKEWNRISELCNDSDLEFFEKIADIYNPGQEFHMVFVSKEKFIKHLNE